MAGSSSSKANQHPRKQRWLVKDPLRYKTALCANWARTGSCPYSFKCQFAHGQDELRDRVAKGTAAAADPADSGKASTASDLSVPSGLCLAELCEEPVCHPVSPESSETTPDNSIRISSTPEDDLSDMLRLNAITGKVELPSCERQPSYHTSSVRRQISQLFADEPAEPAEPFTSTITGDASIWGPLLTPFPTWAGSSVAQSA